MTDHIKHVYYSYSSCNLGRGKKLLVRDTFAKIMRMDKLQNEILTKYENNMTWNIKTYDFGNLDLGPEPN